VRASTIISLCSSSSGTECSGSSDETHIYIEENHIVLIVCLSVIGVLMLIGLIWCMCRECRQKRIIVIKSSDEEKRELMSGGLKSKWFDL
jgi:hypothetical protein